MCDRVPNAMPSSGKDDKQQAADEANPHRNDVQNLLNLPIRLRVEAAHHVLVSQSHRNEHQHR